VRRRASSDTHYWPSHISIQCSRLNEDHTTDSLHPSEFFQRAMEDGASRLITPRCPPPIQIAPRQLERRWAPRLITRGYSTVRRHGFPGLNEDGPRLTGPLERRSHSCNATNVSLATCLNEDITHPDPIGSPGFSQAHERRWGDAPHHTGSAASNIVWACSLNEDGALRLLQAVGAHSCESMLLELTCALKPDNCSSNEVECALCLTPPVVLLTLTAPAAGLNEVEALRLTIQTVFESLSDRERP
jgi:hypothetical protein